MTWTPEALKEMLARGNVRIAEPRVVRFSENQKQQPGPKPKVRLPKAPRKKWSYEERLAQKLEDAGITGFFVDVEYLPERKLRADILFVDARLVVEIQGAAHRIKGKWQADILKAQATITAGFVLLPMATSQVRSGEAVAIIRDVLAVLGDAAK